MSLVPLYYAANTLLVEATYRRKSQRYLVYLCQNILKYWQESSISHKDHSPILPHAHG